MKALSKFSGPDRWMPLLLVLMLLAYTAPWVITPSASMSIGAYDLAEWTSLHPTVRAGTPALRETLLLRLPLACIGLIAAVSAQRRIFHVLFALVIAGALLPPAEFFTSAYNDYNYQQQFALATITLLGNVIGLSNGLGRFRSWLVAGLTLLGGGASSLGLTQGYSLMSAFALPAHLGAGGVALVSLFAICLLLIVMTPGWQLRRQ